jgi:hypothetical protein
MRVGRADVASKKRTTASKHYRELEGFVEHVKSAVAENLFRSGASACPQGTIRPKVLMHQSCLFVAETWEPTTVARRAWRSEKRRWVTLSPDTIAVLDRAVRPSLAQGTRPCDGTAVIGYSTVTVNDPAVATCPGGGTQGTLSVQILPSASDGTVTSLTFGINCPSVACIAVVPVGTSVTLTATASSGHSFVSWQGCTPTSSNSCTVGG